MKSQDKKDIRKYREALRFAGNLRTFPNGRKMELFYACSLNQLGKLLENLDAYLDELTKGKKQRKILRIIGETDAKIGNIRHGTGKIDARM